MLSKKDRAARYAALEAVFLNRINNTRQLIEQAGGTNAFARRVGVSPPYVSAIAGPRPVKQINERSARRFEAAFGLENGWLDQAR